MLLGLSWDNFVRVMREEDAAVVAEIKDGMYMYVEMYVVRGRVRIPLFVTVACSKIW